MGGGLRLRSVSAEARLLLALPPPNAGSKALAIPDAGLGLPRIVPTRASRRRSPMIAGPIPTAPGALFDLLALGLARGSARGGSYAELVASLRALGFRNVRPNRMKKGTVEVDLRLSELAGRPVVHVTFRGRAKGIEVEREGVYFGGVMFDPACFRALDDRYRREIDAFTNALSSGSAGDVPTDSEGLQAFIAAGMSDAAVKKRREHEQEIARAITCLTRQIRALRSKGQAPKGVVVYMSGPDAGGKSSTGGIILDAFEAGGYRPRREVFKAPAPHERRDPNARFRRGIPKAGEVVLWDRGPCGDYVYGGRPLDDVAKGYARLEREMNAQGILVIPVELSASPKKQAETLGKRLARSTIADRIEDARSDLSKDDLASLASIRGKVDADDFAALASFDEIQARFLELVATGRDWIVLDSTHRHRARLALIEAVGAVLGATRGSKRAA
jgi:hypothetical protein